MNSAAKLAMLAATGAVTVAAPALAKTHPAHPTHPTHPSHPTQPATSHKCSLHNVAYVASGTVVAWAATGTGDTYSGTVTIDVTRANHHAAAAKGSDVTYTLDGARVRIGKGANPPVSGDRAKVIGKITQLAKACTAQTGAGTVTIRKVSITRP